MREHWLLGQHTSVIRRRGLIHGCCEDPGSHHNFEERPLPRQRRHPARNTDNRSGRGRRVGGMAEGQEHPTRRNLCALSMKSVANEALLR